MGRLSIGRGNRRGNRRQRRLGDRLPGPRQIGRAALRALSRQRRPLVAAAIAAAAIAAVAGARAWVTTSPRFAVNRVAISGAQRVPGDALEARLGLADRPNLFLYDIDAAIERLEASPWIRRASISRDLPDGLEIEIEEREPRALLVIDGALYLTDLTGAPFKRATADEAVGLELIAITGLTREALAADDVDSTALARRAIALAGEWAGGDRPALGEINIDPVRGFTAITRDRAIAVRLGAGEPDAIAARLRLFDRTWKALEPDERERVAMVHLEQASRPRRASVAFEPAQ